MKLTIEGSFEEIRQLFGNSQMIGSVLPAPEISAARKDRKKISVSVRAADEISEQDPDRIKKEDLLIPYFKYERALETYKELKFAEFDDGRIVLRYMDGIFCTTKDNVAKLPLPLPVGYLTHSGLLPNANTAFRLYCEYLASNNVEKGSVKVPESGPGIKEDRKSEDDIDRAFKPMLKGAFSTRTDYDGGKIEGALS